MLLPDFDEAARRFQAKGWQAVCCAEAMWRFRRSSGTPSLQLLVTVGVHGNETAPIELLARRLNGWADAADELKVDLFLAVGNLDAVAAGERYLRYDMNRMFGTEAPDENWTHEGARARLLASSMAVTIGNASGVPCVHLDLHTTIRPSLKPTFALVPGEAPSGPLLRWLGTAGLHAAVLSPGPGSTLSSFTARLGAASCTVELGKAGVFGANDMGLLSGFDTALDTLLRHPDQAWPVPGHPGPAIPTYRVTRELIRSSEQFELLVPADAPNFQPLALGQVVAIDNGQAIRASHPGECVLFPNPAVALGLRAGLLVAPASGATA